MAISKYFDEFPLRHATTDGITTRSLLIFFVGLESGKIIRN